MMEIMISIIKKLTNVGEGVSSSDAVNKHQLTVGLNQEHDNTGNI